MPWSRDQLRKTEGLHWLLDLTWGGRHYFFAEQHLSADPYNEGAEDWHTGLVVGGPLPDSVDPFSDSPEPRSVNITLHFPPGVDVPDLVARGYDLGSATGVLMLWAEGTTEGEVVIDGVVRAPEYASKHEPVTFALEELPFQDTALWPPARAVVDSSTFPNHDNKAKGERYPWVIGEPPVDTADTFGSAGLAVNVQGNPVTTFELLIAGHHCEAGTVGVRNTSDDSGDTFTIVNGTDGDGNPYAYVDLFEGAPNNITKDDGGDPYWVRWGAPTHAGGVQHLGDTLRGAGDVLEWWLARTSLRWDAGRVAAITPRLNAFVIDGTFTAGPDKRVSPWDWIKEHLLPILPISARMGPQGLYFVWYEWDARASQARIDINADNGACHRASAIIYTERDDVVNEWRLAYLLDAESDKHRNTAVVTGSQETSATGGDSVVRHGLCERSNALYGHRVGEMSSDVICAADTAGRVLMWRASAFAMQHRLVTYVCPRDFAYLNPGDVVTVTDAEVGLSGAVGLVDSIPWGPASAVPVTVRLLSQGREWAT